MRPFPGEADGVRNRRLDRNGNDGAQGHRRVIRRVVTFLVRAAASLWALPIALEVRMSPLLSVEDAAAELGTPVRFVRRLVHERRIRFHKIGKYVRIARTDLEEFVAAGAIAPLPPRRPS